MITLRSLSTLSRSKNSPLVTSINQHWNNSSHHSWQYSDGLTSLMERRETSLSNLCQSQRTMMTLPTCLLSMGVILLALYHFNPIALQWVNTPKGWGPHAHSCADIAKWHDITGMTLSTSHPHTQWRSEEHYEKMAQWLVQFAIYVFQAEDPLISANLSKAQEESLQELINLLPTTQCHHVQLYIIHAYHNVLKSLLSQSTPLLTPSCMKIPSQSSWFAQT